MKNLFLVASGTLAVVPGLLTLQSGVSCPPGTKVLFGDGVEAFGALALLLLWANRERLAALSRAAVAGLTIGLALLGLAGILVYTGMLDICVAEPQSAPHKEYRPVSFPLWLNEPVADLVRKAGSRTAALDRYGPEDIVTKLRGCSK